MPAQGEATVANKDLRDWIDGVEAAGELKVIIGAEPKEEIGGIVDIYQRRMGNPAIMFDEVPGFPKGSRVLANILTSVPRINIALGLPPQGSAMDLQKIPTPKWHEHDGGHFIGTACMVVMKDPDSGWVNYGAYRIQTQGPDVPTVMLPPGKHGPILMGKYHERGQPCPVAVVCGMHPGLFMLAGLEIPYGKSEFEAAGGLMGEPVEVINMPKTGLPGPANAE